MNKSMKRVIVAGVLATIVMTIITMLAPMMGMPKMSPPNMLAGMLGMPIFVGWVMHFMIGIVFAVTYQKLFSSKLPINNVLLKGAVFGVVVFVFAQLVMKLMGAMMGMPAMEGSLVMQMVGSLIGHIVYGIVVAKVVAAK